MEWWGEARCAQRVEAYRVKSELFRNDCCRRTMAKLADDWERRARGMREAAIGVRGGLRPYEAALLFILNEQRNDRWSGPKSQLANLRRGDVGKIRCWHTVRMLAYAFNKSERDIARDLVELFARLEDGQWAP